MVNIDVNIYRIQRPVRFLKYGLSLAILSSVWLYPQEIYAATLREIAMEFLNRTDAVYEEEKEFNAFDQIPDGGTLLLRPRSSGFSFDQDIYAVKSGNDVYLSLFDFINVLEFPIDYNRESRTGYGWFLREDWTIDLNLAAGAVRSRGTTYTLTDQDVVEQDGDFFVSSDALEKWFGLVMEVNPEQQIVDIESPFPFPAVAKAERDSRFRGRNDRVRLAAQLPRLEQPKSNFDINTADVSLGGRVQKDRYGRTITNETANIALQGEILKHNAYIFTNINDRDGIRNIRGKLFKRSEDADLLGPLNARAYEIGDINEVRIPLVSEADENIGFYFTNSRLENTDFATTDIRGRLFPGWDVQLYRNGIQIDTQTVDNEGEYDFQEIQLFAGENDFELFFFGPQGEIQSQTVSVPVSQALLSSQDNTYEISASVEDSQTFRNNSISDEDTSTPNLTARYNKLIGDNHLTYLGFRTRQVYGDRKFFLTAGSTSTLGRSLLDTNFAVDQNGEASAQALVRRNLLGWDTSLRARINTDDFEYRRDTLQTIYEAAFNAQRFLDFGGFRASLLVDSLYRQTDDQGTFKSLGFALANNFFGASLSNRISYDSSEYDAANNTTTNEENLLHTLSIRKNFGRFFLNLGSTYEISPDSEFRNISAQLNYRYNNKFSTDLTLERDFNADLDRARLNLTYMNDKYRLSPFVQYNTDDEILAGINLNFSMYDDPNSPFPEFTNRKLINRGAMSAFVYHDKNGNHIFDEGDDPISNAALESVPSTRKVVTDEDGYATMYDLPTTRATDISISKNGLDDPFMIPSVAGNSIYPIEGTIYNMEFPVQLTGEIDGIIYSQGVGEDTRQPIPFQNVTLLPLDDPDLEPISVKAEKDGYYVSYLIPPGDYLLMTDKSSSYGNTAPAIITIGLEGPILKDMDIKLVEGGVYVPYEVAYNRQSKIPAGGKSYSRMLRVKQSGKSGLSETLFTMINKQTGDVYDGLVKLQGLSLDNGNYDYYTAIETKDLNDPQYLHDKCAAINASLGECAIIINSTLTR